MAQQGASLQTYATNLTRKRERRRKKKKKPSTKIPLVGPPVRMLISPRHGCRYNNELVKCLEDLREKREQVNKAILKEEKEKASIQKQVRLIPTLGFTSDCTTHFPAEQLQALTERLHKTNESIALKIAARDDYDKTVRETESAYMKILESSQTLLTVLKRESVNLTKKKQSSSGTVPRSATPYIPSNSRDSLFLFVNGIAIFFSPTHWLVAFRSQQTAVTNKKPAPRPLPLYSSPRAIHAHMPFDVFCDIVKQVVCHLVALSLFLRCVALPLHECALLLVSWNRPR